MDTILAAIEQLAQGTAPAESIWFIDGVHEGARSVWIAVCSDGTVQRRTRGIDALPSSRGRGREDYDVEMLGTAAPEALAQLASALRDNGLRELAAAGNVAEGERYTLKVALGSHRVDVAVELGRLRSHEPLRAIHQAFYALTEQLTPAPPRDDDAGFYPLSSRRKP